MNALLAFYYGSHTDDRGRRLAEILRQDDAWMELTHDYIQWLFPLAEPSGVNPRAPLVDSATAELFRSDPLLQDHLRAAFARMLRFLGLRYVDGEVTKAANWDARKVDWFTEPTHNSLRVTRVIKSLRLLGMDTEAQAFHRGLVGLCATEPDAGINANARRFWRDAAESPVK
jgi:hypothetical protein